MRTDAGIRWAVRVVTGLALRTSSLWAGDAVRNVASHSWWCWQKNIYKYFHFQIFYEVQSQAQVQLQAQARVQVQA